MAGIWNVTEAVAEFHGYAMRVRDTGGRWLWTVAGRRPSDGSETGSSTSEAGARAAARRWVQRRPEVAKLLAERKAREEAARAAQRAQSRAEHLAARRCGGPALCAYCTAMGISQAEYAAVES